MLHPKEVFGDAEIHVEREVAARSVDPTRVGVQWLDVPHASAAERSFVLAPLADLAPELQPPGWGVSVAGALERARRALHPVLLLAVGFLVACRFAQLLAWMDVWRERAEGAMPW